MKRLRCSSSLWAMPIQPQLVNLLLVVLLLLLVQCPAQAEVRTVALPMNLDMALLKRLIVTQAYTEPGERARVLALQAGCNEVWLAAPQVQPDREMLRFETEVHIRWGTPLGSNCYAPLVWDGSVVLWQEPRIDAQWQLSFAIRDSALLDKNGQPARVVSVLWDLIKEHVHTYLSQITIDLAPPVQNVKEVLLPQAATSGNARAMRFLASMRPQQPRLDGDRLRVDILAEADLPAEQQEVEAQPMASPKDLERVLELWQTWDAMLVRLIDMLSDKPLNDDDRQLLLDTMLVMRYEFSGALEEERLTDAFVRTQFLETWRDLKPMFKRHLTQGQGGDFLGFLSFFTAVDALATLDRIGPVIGIEISRDGFHRLAQLVGNAPLDTGDRVDPRLREALGLDTAQPDLEPGPQGEVRQPEIIEERIAPEPEPVKGSDLPADSGVQYHRFSVKDLIATLVLPGTAHAAQPTMEEVRNWTAGMADAEQLLARVRQVLLKAALRQEGKLKAPATHQGWFLHMLNATAWQESCFRQFVVKKGKVTYLLSYNNTSVGLMQVNEKVWRGIYDLQKLRWDVGYNTDAGAEILSLYLNRYISKYKPPVKLDSKEGRRYLATWLYALYNGGPGQLKKFPARQAKSKLYQSERLFQEKYDRVVGPRWDGAVDCLAGG